MRQKRIISLLLLVITTVPLILCSACGVSEEEKIANRIMLAKYRLPSKETAREDFEWQYEIRLSQLLEAHATPTSTAPFISEYSPKTTYEETAQSFISEAESAGVPLLQYVNSVGVRLPYYYDENDVTDPASPKYYLSYTQWYNNSEAATLYLANLWNVKADEGETIKDAVIDYCMENSRIVYGYPNPERLISKATRRFGVRNNLGQILYVIGEDGYAAVYNRDSEPMLYAHELAFAAGERVYGTVKPFTVSRFCDSNSWEYLISNHGGRLTLLKFDHWIKAGSDDHDAFVKIYGFEPKIHP
ncbi:MAG: hypothetical protein IKM29_03245 [Clostridia bacterium]|nr:hypothetical protein [Clostridia bacterium]